MSGEKASLKITALKAVQIARYSQSIIKIETDAGITGYGEAGGPGYLIRANLKQFEPLLLGQDPFDTTKLFEQMVNIQHPNRPHIPTASAVDIALWDIVGKVLEKSVSKICRGQYRDEIPIYVNVFPPSDYRNNTSCRDWAKGIEEHPLGFKAVKMEFCSLFEQDCRENAPGDAHRHRTIKPSELDKIRSLYENCREALDPSIDIIVHCHNEYDLPSAIGIAKAVESIKPMWLEDPLPVLYTDSWKSFKESVDVPILTGEKLELPREFLPFLENGIVDLMQPDIIFAGGFTGSWRIAELCDMFYVPVTAHNIGSVVQIAATSHFGASVRNFMMSETTMNLGQHYMHQDIIEERIVVKDGMLRVPEGPGLGITVNEEAIKRRLPHDEPFWD